MMITELKKFALHGSAEAQIAIGILCEHGLYPGALKSEEDALAWYTNAMNAGSLLGQRCAAHLLIKKTNSTPDFERGVNLLRDGSEKGDPGAQLDLVYYIQLGKIIPVDESEIFYLAEKAANSNFAPAAGYLGYMYQFGRGGVTQNDTLAFKWYLRGAELGEADSAASVAEMYIKGRGVEKDDGKAVQWLEEGLRRNSVLANKIMSSAYLTGKYGKPPDAQKAKEYRDRAKKLLADERK